MPILIVFVLILTTARTIYTVQAAPRPPGAIGVHVVGHQWWWEFQYPDLGIVTANELHVPVSDPRHPTPTFLDLESADVAHSFWVPRLAGKTDLIPNKKNSMWIDPHEPGIYLGQCAEYCGTEHALMLLRVVVQPRDEWERWVASQRQPAVAGRCGRAWARGLRVDRLHQLSHRARHGGERPVRTRSDASDEPETLGAGVALNTPAHLKIWVNDPSVDEAGRADAGDEPRRQGPR